MRWVEEVVVVKVSLLLMRARCKNEAIESRLRVSMIYLSGTGSGACESQGQQADRVKEGQEGRGG